MSVQMPEIRIMDTVTQRRQLPTGQQLVSLGIHALEKFTCHGSGVFQHQGANQGGHYPQISRTCICAISREQSNLEKSQQVVGEFLRVFLRNEVPTVDADSAQIGEWCADTIGIGITAGLVIRYRFTGTEALG